MNFHSEGSPLPLVPIPMSEYGYWAWEFATSTRLIFKGTSEHWKSSVKSLLLSLLEMFSTVAPSQGVENHKSEDWVLTEGSESESDDDSFDTDSLDTLRPGKHRLNVSERYCRSWTTQDAFRQILQNWYAGLHLSTMPHHLNIPNLNHDSKDACVVNFKLDPCNLPIERVERKTGITFNIRHPGPNSHRCLHGHQHNQGDLIGYIRLKTGLLVVVNFEARLNPRALELGGTTKQNISRAADEHGEGFKVAALAMLRNDYAMTYEASDHYWNFRFDENDPRHLHCNISAIKGTKLAKLKKKAEGKTTQSREANSRNWEDVAVRIGKRRKLGRTSILLKPLGGSKQRWISVLRPKSSIQMQEI